MSLESIGFAFRYPGEVTFDDGVILPVPYGDSNYDVAVTNSELDQLAVNEVVRHVGNQAVLSSRRSAYDRIVKLNGGDLPLYVGVRKLSSGSHSLLMTLAVVTQSVVYEHRGLAYLSKSYSPEGWQLDEYRIQPPLRYPEHEVIQN